MPDTGVNLVASLCTIIHPSSILHAFFICLNLHRVPLTSDWWWTHWFVRSVRTTKESQTWINFKTSLQTSSLFLPTLHSTNSYGMLLFWAASFLLPSSSCSFVVKKIERGKEYDDMRWGWFIVLWWGDWWCYSEGASSQNRSSPLNPQLNCVNWVGSTRQVWVSWKWHELC